MQFDLDAVREVFALFVEHHVTGRHEEQAPVALKKKLVAFVSSR